MASSSPEKLSEDLLYRLQRIAEKFWINLNAPSPGAALETLTASIHDYPDEKAVVLVDEYDCPVNHNADDPPLMVADSKILGDFYVSLMNIDSCLRFVFVTGVTRCAMMDLPAGLNSLSGISLNSQYAAVCGFTPEESDLYFRDHCKSLLEKQDLQDYPKPQDAAAGKLKNKILTWYDGCTWDGKTKVLNSCSINSLFDQGEF
jgi:hypothetical protein